MLSRPTPLIGGTLGFKPVMRITGKFTVPAYQRGYRWGKEEVGQLVDDIVANSEQNYCLQPVVVKRISDDNWELIDGQQRLTTLFLLVRALGETPPWTMDFMTRPGSTDFLGQPVRGPRRREHRLSPHLRRPRGRSSSDWILPILWTGG